VSETQPADTTGPSQAEPPEPPAGPPDPPADPPAPPPKRKLHPLGELVLVLAAAFGIWYVTNGWVVKPYQIPSSSMVPTLQVGDRVLVSRFVYRLHDPRRGDIVVFHPPGQGDVPERGATTEASVYFIKRIIGLPGETIQGRGGHVQICHQTVCHDLSEPYLKSSVKIGDFGPVQIPQGDYFMMGDNRGDSDDSRDWGVLPRANIVGEAFATYWPLDRIHIL
jgi:signal peptidase I